MNLARAIFIEFFILMFTRASSGTVFFAKGYGRLKDEFVIKKISCGSHLQASSKCSLTKNCRSFSRSKKGQCVLYNGTVKHKEAVRENIVENLSWELYERQTDDVVNHSSQHSLCIPCNATNLALNKETEQSSTYTVGLSSNMAVDGKRTTNIGCTLTNLNSNPWWKVNLSQNKEFSIKNITIYNRMDCCSERLSNASIFVVRNGINHYCSKIGDMANVEVKTFNCTNTLFGNEVLIQKTGTTYFNLCEVEVYGQEYEEGKELCAC